jgi:hyaluronoglucosaminidase
MSVELGIIEGFYGRPWTWQDREETIRFLQPHGYGFYLYAPKADPYLRKRWREPHTEELQNNLLALSASSREVGVRFGVGITPYDLRHGFDPEAKEAFAAKLAFFDEIGVVDLGILFDDLRGDNPDLAVQQAEIVEWVASRTSATRIIVCPSYYTNDPVLDRVFGERPERYLEQLGELIDPSIEIFWTGEEVCSRAFSVGHLEGVAEKLRRKPFLWDNYPVNDGQRMSQYLHLRGFTGRPAEIGDYISAHGVNPALQPTLSRIPCLTLVDSYAMGSSYSYGEAFVRAAEAVIGEELARKLYQDVLVLQDVGLDRLGDKEALIRSRYEGDPSPAAREIVDWLDGGYRITDEIVQTQ